MEKFKLNHTLLYAKNWYKKSDDIIKDLQKTILADGYGWDEIGKADIAELLLNKCKRIDIPAFNDLTEFARGINPRHTNRVGYYQKECWVLPNYIKEEDLEDYDIDLAITYYCLSSLGLLGRKYFNELTPDYENVLPQNIINKLLTQNK